ncbi:hypothetical protein C5E45_30760 [Nocardia nova]|uniref:Uncharacterized protein n=1 Tax=Nocardia nova TaxID=37330 RepID=A0A2S6AGX6_9NOCA|nr:hypothetical protein [Nocardia nova]PPJ28777.1 hypothetical protein C5E41_11910 [Nocardia nova]PPJ34017.1 hypothetical protein C5E45_30760 [Nocardia nova]
MSILFGIGLVIWFVSIAAMFLARALDDRSQQAFRASVGLCAVGSTLLAIGTPFVSGNTTGKNILFTGGFVVMAVLCAYSVLIMRHRPATPPIPLPIPFTPPSDNLTATAAPAPRSQDLPTRVPAPKSRPHNPSRR